MYRYPALIDRRLKKGEIYMLALIKREIEDHIVYFLGAAGFSASLIAIAIHSAYALHDDKPPYLISVYPVFVIISMLGFCSMGVTQMYTDRTRKISSFLSTLAATRRRILTSIRKPVVRPLYGTPRSRTPGRRCIRVMSKDKCRAQ